MNTSILGLLKSMGEGRLPNQRIRLADYKPRGQETASLEALKHAFFESVARLRTEGCDSAARAAPELKKTHPWLGDLSARGWLTLSGVHLFIHLKQLRGIRRGLVG